MVRPLTICGRTLGIERLRSTARSDQRGAVSPDVAPPLPDEPFAGPVVRLELEPEAPLPVELEPLLGAIDPVLELGLLVEALEPLLLALEAWSPEFIDEQAAMERAMAVAAAVAAIFLKDMLVSRFRRFIP